MPAITAASLGTDQDETDASSYAINITPSANKLILAMILTNQNSSLNTPTASGNGLTWVEVATTTDGDSRNRLTMFRAMGASPTSGLLTFDFAGNTQSREVISVVEFTGMDTTGTNGSGAVVQSATNGATTGTSLTVTLSAFADATNATFGVLMVNDNPATTITEGTGFTEVNENKLNEIWAIHTEFKDTNDTTVDWTWTGGGFNQGIAVEIKAAAAVGHNFQTLLGVR